MKESGDEWRTKFDMLVYGDCEVLFEMYILIWRKQKHLEYGNLSDPGMYGDKNSAHSTFIEFVSIVF